MIEQINEAYIGSGVIYVNGRDVGNCENVNFSIEQDTKAQRNYRGGGGNFASRTTISSVKLSLTLLNFSNANLALALRGIVTIEAAGAIADEEVTAVLGGLAETAKMIDTSNTATTLTVTNSDASVTYEEGTDYEPTAAGLKILADGAIGDGDVLKVSYANRGTSLLQALVDSGEDVRVVMDGVNDDSNKPCIVRVHRWKPAPTSGLDLISEDYASFPLEGEVLADQSIQAAGKSKFFMREAA